MTKGKYESSSNTWSVFSQPVTISSQTQTQIQIQLITEFLEGCNTNTETKQIKKAAKFSQQREQKKKYKYKRIWGENNKSPE